MSGGAAVKLASISDLPFETVETLIFEGLLQLQSKRLVPGGGALRSAQAAARARGRAAGYRM